MARRKVLYIKGEIALAQARSMNQAGPSGREVKRAKSNSFVEEPRRFKMPPHTHLPESGQILRVRTRHWLTAAQMGKLENDVDCAKKREFE
jgi:hypothetical protein